MSLKYKWYLLTVIFLILLLINNSHIVSANESNLSVMLDFSRKSNLEDFYTDLDGEWYFFEEELLTPDEVKDYIKQNKGIKVNLPDSFQSHTGLVNTYGTYSTIIKVPDQITEQSLAIHIPYQYGAYQLYVNQNKVIESGTVGFNKVTHETEMSPKIGYFSVQSGDILLTMQVSSFEHIRGGFENSIYLGPASTVQENFNTDLIGILFINGCVFIIGLFMFLFGLYRRKEYVFLIFGMFAMFISARALFTDPFYYKLIFTNMSWLWGTRLEYVLTEASSMFYVILLWKWHEKEFSNKVMYGLVSLHIILIVATLVTKPLFFQALFFKVFYLAIPTFLYLIYVVYKSIRNHNKTAKINLFGMSLIFLAFFNDFAIAQNIYQSWNLMLPAVATYVLIHVLLMSKDFADRTKRTELQNEELLLLNKSNEKLNVKLQKEIKRKDDFLANTSHELRNPLHGIINITQSLLRHQSTHLNKEVKDNLALQLTISHHMSQTLKDLLDITRLKEGKIELQLQRLQIGSVVNGVVDMFKVFIENKNVQIKREIPQDFPYVVADKNRLIQILFNLIHNAVKYTEKGTITIKAYTNNDMAHIQVHDTGKGIDDITIQSIFEPYEQGSQNAQLAEGGIGLGLSICKQLVDMHKGTLTATSVVGEGSTFTFTLPLTTNCSTDESMMTILDDNETTDSFNNTLTPLAYNMIDVLNKKATPITRPRILVVDDNPVNLKLLLNILSANYYDVKTALSGEEALKKVNEQGWDLVITDVMMPSMSGYELTKSIRKKFSISELPILMLTARGNMEDIYTGFSAGANDYVIKPVDTIELNARVHALTDVQVSIQERLSMEAAWLQAQMKPHFLLNTLNSIVSLSAIDTDRMVKLIEQFAQYLQSSFHLKNIDQLIPLKKEIKLLESYLYIEQERFGDRLNVKWDIDDLIAGVMVPPLSIQTLVENAVNHGVLKKADGGLVTIKLKRDKEHMTVSIIDDGVGMDEAKINDIFSPTLTSKGGIGIVNTDKRLKKLYGKGLTIKSTPNVGTTISFTVPYRFEQDR